MYNFQTVISTILLLTSLLSLLIIWRGSRNVQTFALFQLALIVLMTFALNIQGGYLADLSLRYLYSSSVIHMIAQLVIAGLGLVLYFRKRPLG